MCHLERDRNEARGLCFSKWQRAFKEEARAGAKAQRQGIRYKQIIIIITNNNNDE